MTRSLNFGSRYRSKRSGGSMTCMSESTKRRPSFIGTSLGIGVVKRVAATLCRQGMGVNVSPQTPPSPCCARRGTRGCRSRWRPAAALRGSRPCVQPLVIAPRRCMRNSCGRLAAHIMAIASRLRILRGIASRPQISPYAYWLMSFCSGAPNSPADDMRRSTSSAPKISLRMFIPV